MKTSAAAVTPSSTAKPAPVARKAAPRKASLRKAAPAKVGNRKAAMPQADSAKAAVTSTPTSPAASQSIKSSPAAGKKSADSTEGKTTVKIKSQAKAEKAGASAGKKAGKSKPAKPVKDKLVRDGFTMPESEFKLIDAVKQRAMAFKREVKKSEVLRAGLKALQGLSEPQLKALLETLPTLKTGRPKKGH